MKSAFPTLIRARDERTQPARIVPGYPQTPWRNPALWVKLSYPFFHADRIRTPTLFLGGDRDFNVPVSGGEQMYQALKTLGVPATLVVYPGQHHVFTRPSFVKDLEERMSQWLQRYVPAQPQAQERVGD